MRRETQGRLWFGAGLLILLAIADLALTKTILDLGGYEANPLTAPWIDSTFGVVVKTAGVAAVAMLVAANVRSPWLVRIFYSVVAVYGVVVAWNVVQLAGAYV